MVAVNAHSKLLLMIASYQALLCSCFLRSRASGLAFLRQLICLSSWSSAVHPQPVTCQEFAGVYYTITGHQLLAGAGETGGYFVQTLVDAGLISPDVQRQPDCPEEALGLAVNHCIVRSSTVRGVFNVIRDLLPVFDTVNTATSMHRIAKTAKYDKVRQGRPRITAFLLRSCSRMMMVALLD